MKTVTLKVVIEVPDDYIINEPEWTLEDSILNSDSKCEIADVGELSEKKKPMMGGAEYLQTIPVTGMSIQNIPTTISTAFEDGKRSMDVEWHSVMKQYCEEHDLNYLDFIKEIAPMFSDAQEETEEPVNYGDAIQPGKFYLVNVSGKNGYSFMVKTEMEDESDILEKCSELDLFDCEEDSNYAFVSEADKYDQEHFKEYNYLDL